jgi:CHASE2 domain-containing sensor protein
MKTQFLKMRYFLVLGMLATYCSMSSANAWAAPFENDFVVVFIDSKTEEKFGKIPLDRRLLAEAAEKIAEARAKGIVFKFFFDLPKDSASDAKLEKIIAKIPVILQACFDNKEAAPNELPSKFVLTNLHSKTFLKGTSGWIPLPSLIKNAADVGFVDYIEDYCPILESYKGKTVKSLILCAAEMATGKKAVIQTGKQITIGSKTIPLDETDGVQVSMPDPAKITYIPFHQILDGSSPPGAFAGKVVIIGYDGPNIHELPTKYGKVKAHRILIAYLKGFYDQLQSTNTP